MNFFHLLGIGNVVPNALVKLGAAALEAFCQGKVRVQVNLIINNRAGGNAPLIAEKIAERLHKEKQQRLF